MFRVRVILFPETPSYLPVDTKPAYIPKNKLKNLNWTKVLLVPKEAPTKQYNIWDDTKEVSLDSEEVEELFKTKKTIVNTLHTENEDIISKKRVLEAKRIQKVAISINKIPKIDDLQIVFTNMKPIPQSSLLALKNILLEPSELSEIENYQQEDPTVEFEKEETALLKFETIKNIRKKIDIWLFIFDYQENIDIHKDSISNSLNCVIEIKESKIFKTILSVLLSLGNIMNGDTKKGRADGFHLDLLTKLTSTKDNNGKTVNHFVIMYLKKQDSEFRSLTKMFPSVMESSNYSISEAASYLKKAEKEVTKYSKILENLEEDNYKSNIKKEYSLINEEITSLSKKIDEFYKEFKDMALYYGFSEKEQKVKEPEEFWKFMTCVLTDFEKNIPKEEIKKTFNRTHKIGAKITDKTSDKENEKEKNKKIEMPVLTKKSSLFENNNEPLEKKDSVLIGSGIARNPIANNLAAMLKKSIEEKDKK